MVTRTSQDNGGDGAPATGSREAPALPREEVDETELREARHQIADLSRELEETNRGLIALYTELTEARQAEARLAAIVTSSDDAVFALTLEGVIATWNPGAERLLGHAPAQALGAPVGTLLADAAREFGVALERIRSGGHAEPYDCRWHRKDGSEVDVAITLSGIRDAEGVLVGFSTVAQDITTRVRAQSELAAARASREVMADRERIARDMHDMVIQRVFGAALALQSAAGLVGDAKARGRLVNVIGELDTTIKELRSTIFDLNEGLQRATSLRAGMLELITAARHGLGFAPAVTFEGPVDNAVPDEIAVHLLVVVREALSNMSRHAGASAAEVALAVGTELELTIEDNGRGIGATTRRSGLANMAQRARELGGDFEVTSEPGEGTRLRWHIPLP